MKKIFLKNLYRKLLNRIYNPFLMMNIKPMPLEIQADDNCLVIAPHPDDESIGCGGIMKLYPKNFDVICLTHGDKDDIRTNEMQQAMEFANVKSFKLLDLQDKNVIDGQDKFNKINIANYDYIFIPYIFDQHKDHKAVSLFLNKLLKLQKHKSNLKIAFYEVWSAINMPQYFVDISDVIDKKKEMINCHKSQIATKDYANKISGLNSYRGLLKGLSYAECFTILSYSDFMKYTQKIIFDLDEE